MQEYTDLLFRLLFGIKYGEGNKHLFLCDVSSLDGMLVIMIAFSVFASSNFNFSKASLHLILNIALVVMYALYIQYFVLLFQEFSTII